MHLLCCWCHTRSEPGAGAVVASKCGVKCIVAEFTLVGQVEKQIKQMVDFIRQEAEEKANEIRVSAEEVLPCLQSSVLAGVVHAACACVPGQA